MYEFSHAEAIIIFITNKYLNMAEKKYVTEDDGGNCFGLYYSEKLYMTILIDSWYLGGEQIHISIINKFKFVILIL